MPFQKVRSTKVSAIVAEQIVDAIQNGHYPVGSRLPSEAELAEQMGVSRPSIREALSALEAVGLIEAKAGSGNYVRKLPSSGEAREAPLLIESEAGCLEVIEARSALEPPVAALVAEKGPAQNANDFHRTLREMRTQARKGQFSLYFNADKAFHLALAEAAGNRLITTALIPLINTMDQQLYREFTRHYYLKNATDLERVVDLHEEILQAVMDHEPQAAFDGMREHWRRMKEIWEA
jgi:GntR family transcriptional repressor for pyruvate dehydrogenase complex